MDAETLAVIGGVLVLLIAATAAASYLRRRADSTIDPGLVESFRVRLRAWWLLFAALAGAFFLGKAATVLLFGLISFWALREFITLTPTRPGDHRTLFWVFFLCTPLQFVLVAWQRYDWYSILIPVFAFLFIPARIALSGDPKRFLERTAKIQAGLLICVYCLSYAPALLTIPLPRPAAVDGQSAPGGAAGRQTTPAEPSAVAAAIAKPEPGNNNPLAAEDSQEDRPADATAQWSGLAAGNTKLLLFFVLMVQLSDVLQYAWSKVPSCHVVAPAINHTKTWEGFLGGTASAVLLGTVLWFCTPFPHWWHAALASLVVAVLGFAGSLTMSAIKRDRGVRDYGTLVEGHGGVLDRIDSMCFAAPVFFHVARFLLSTPAA